MTVTKHQIKKLQTLKQHVASVCKGHSEWDARCPVIVEEASRVIDELRKLAGEDQNHQPEASRRATLRK